MGAAGAAAWPAQAPLFVGRGGELTFLHDALRRAAAGRPGMVLVAGEAGVGKSRLAGRFAGQARRAGALVAVGGAAPLTGGALPYAPLLQALRALADDHEPAALGGRGVELAGVLAELAGDRPEGERVPPPEVGRGRLFERLRAVLGLLGQAAGLLLVLEDLHWADSATLDVLAFVLRTLRGARLLVVGTYRADDPGELLAGWLAETRRLPEVSWLELPRFTRAELAAQLAGLRGGPVDSRVVAEVFDRSQGNPFFAEQLFAAGGRAGPVRLPGLLREVLLARVRQLSPAGQQLLRVAAVGGRSVCHDWLAAVAGGPDDELAGALREAVDCGLLQITEMEQAGQEVYEFRHALLQEAVYGQLLPGQRARLHGAYAHALAGMPAGGCRRRSSPRNWPSTGIGPASRPRRWPGRCGPPTAPSGCTRMGRRPGTANGCWSCGTRCPTPRAGPGPTGPPCTPGPHRPGSTPATKPGRWHTSRRRCGRWTRPQTRSGPAYCTASAAGTTSSPEQTT